MKIILIAAISENNALGKDNKLLWKLSADLAVFKKLTTNNIILMGRKTFDSIGKALPNRINMVLTKNKYFYEDNVVSVDGIKKAFELAREYNKDLYIIGGGQIYEMAMDWVDEMYITHVKCTIDADTFFPEINKINWDATLYHSQQKDEKNEFDFDVIHYTKSSRN